MTAALPPAEPRPDPDATPRAAVADAAAQGIDASDAPRPGSVGTAQWRALVARTEGRVLVVGLAMTLAIAAGVGVGLMLAPRATLDYAALIGLNLVIGRAAGMSYGFASGMGPLEVVLVNLFVESAQVLVVYPLFVLGWRELLDTRRIAPMLARLRTAAEAGHGRVRRFGVAGLFVFVFMPFWMTGPVVGAIVGFLLGLRTAVNLAVVLSATALAIVIYARFLDQIDAWASAVHPYAVFAVLVALAVLAWGIQRWMRRARVRDEVRQS
ncbi:small multi-drug export protein [Azohydromonas sediminis]|uniref:small multi-drug export protein n=1 Tax=Azohydromonas sediminis TaxID=2259674 RepID=UPI000E64611C|nr:small multi-drug export protein [Azohydromonas sediminis]